MLTCEQYRQLKAIHQMELDGTPCYSGILTDWMDDLFSLLGDMALRNELLRAENAELRRVMNLNKKAE